MTKLTFLPIAFTLNIIFSVAQVKHYTVHDGLATEEVRQMVELPNGQIMVNSEGGFELFDGRSFRAIPYDRTKVFNLTNYVGYYHTWQGDSLLWLRDFYHLYLYDTQRNAFRYDVDHFIKADTLLQQMVDGALTYLPCDDTWQRLGDSVRRGAHVDCAVTDRQGGKWIGTQVDGVFYIPPARPQIKTEWLTDSMRIMFESVKDKQGLLWRSTDKGLACYTSDCRHITTYNSSNTDGFVHDRMIFAYFLSDGRLLLCNHHQLLGYFDTSRHTFAPLNCKQPAINDYRHIIGACQLSKNKVAVYSQNGAFILNVKTDSVETFGAVQGIAPYTDKYNCMIKDTKGRIWIGTQNGLFIYDGRHVLRISSADGLNSNCIRALSTDKHGNIWVGTSAGISRIKSPQKVTCGAQPPKGSLRINNYGVNDGMPESYVQERKAMCLSDGSIAFASKHHLLIIRPEDFDNKGMSMPIVITTVIVNEKQINTCGGITLPYNKNHITVTFSALNYVTPEHTQYRYRLKGFDNLWTYNLSATGNSTAQYTSLPHGDYTLEMQSSVEGQEWSEATLLPITILPPWWLSWWAKALYTLFFIVTVPILLHLYLKKKTAQMEKANEEKVNKLFTLREEARSHFAKSVKIDPQKVSVFKDEEELVNNMLKAIERNMDNPEYTVNQLAADVAHSRSNLYRRIQSILGITPNDFIRNVRLKHAACLLSETSMSVINVAQAVGFSSSGYFSKCFKKAFGVLPSEYKRNDVGTKDEADNTDAM